jgi:hypothetical protein
VFFVSDPQSSEPAADEPKPAKSPARSGSPAKSPARSGSPAKSAARSGNPAKAAQDSTAKVSRTPVKPKRIGNRWAAPAMLVSAVIGLIWIVVFYTAGEQLPYMKELGNWNLVVGMGFIVAAFGFSMKWE